MLVENAIKHNISTKKSPLIIKICIHAEAVTVSNNLQIRNYAEKSGTGLQNLQRQYALYHKDIKIVKTATEFSVRIPLLD